MAESYKNLPERPFRSKWIKCSMSALLTFDVTPAEKMQSEEKQELIQFCTIAYSENFEGLFEGLPGSVHVRARLAGTLVSHAAWVTRWLQPQELPLLRTAYVEAVA